MRGSTIERWPKERVRAEVDVAGSPVRVKVSAGRVKVENDDAARVARLTGLPLREVVSRAEEAWRRRDERPSAAPRPRTPETDASLDYGGVVERGPWPDLPTDTDAPDADDPDDSDDPA